MGRGGGGLCRGRGGSGRARRAVPECDCALQTAEGLCLCRRAAEEQLREDSENGIARDGRETEATMTLIAKLALVLVGSAVYLGLAVLGWGGFSAFFSHPALIALTAVTVAMSFASLF